MVIYNRHDIFGNIKDNRLRTQFIQIHFEKTPMYFYILIFLFFCFILLPIQILHCIYNHQHEIHIEIFLILELVLIIGICLLSGWLCCIKYFRINFQAWMMNIKHLFLILVGCYQILRHIQINILNHCYLHETTLHSVICRSAEANISSLIMITAPIILVSVLREYNLIVSFGYYFTSSVCLLIGYMGEHDYPTSTMILIFIFGGAMLLYDLQIQKVSTFLLNDQIKRTLDETERNASRHHADEMRHMIANVAHDLKTPLTSFMTGIDLIAHLASDCCQDEIGSKGIETNLIQENMNSVLQCLESLRNTNSFMLMTINRCIDYTKASKGMKLIPRYETLELVETLSLPLSCMRNIQHRIQIIFNPLPKEISSHIITDLQWLQENILCLLSNAVKYSTEGQVTITVSLVDVISPRRAQAAELKNFLVRTIRIPNNRIAPDDTTPIRRFANTIPSTFAHDIRHASSADSNIGTEDPNQAFNLLSKHIRFEIEDTGIGLSDEAMSSLFSPFNQTQRLAGGTGLGLYSLAKRVEALNGKYGVRRRRDGQKGSLFWFSFPYRPDDQYMNLSTKKKESSFRSTSSKSSKSTVFIHDTIHRQEPEDELIQQPSENNVNSPAHLKQSTPTGSPRHKHSFSIHSLSYSIKTSTSWQVLVVDDSPTILKMTSMILSKQGHSVSTAENGEEAVKLITSRLNRETPPFDIILMDLQMPVMDGLEATRRIRDLLVNETSFYQIIIGFSANSDNDTSDAAFKAGIDAFIPKPFKIDTFYKVANETIEKVKQ